MQPLYRKSNAPYYHPEISHTDRLTFQWWAGVLRQKIPRLVVCRNPWPDLIIYTDAAGETMITAALLFDRAEFMRSGCVSAVRSEVASLGWIELFRGANSIYGLELLAIALTTADSSLDLENKSITYYIDNNNALSALVKADSKRMVIAILARLFWALVGKGV